MPDPLVLLPGMMCDARVFGPQIAELSADTTLVVAPVSQGERVEEIASRLLDSLPRRFALAGQGLGGMVAVEILRRSPDRVTRLALIATTALPEAPQVAASRETSIVRARAGRLADVMAEEIPLSAVAPGENRIEVRDLLLDMADTLGPQVFIRQSRAMQRRRDQQDTLRKSPLPTLILCGAGDRHFPVKRQTVLAELMRGSELLVLEDAGHWPSLEAPAETTSAIRRWLDGDLAPRLICGGVGVSS